MRILLFLFLMFSVATPSFGYDVTHSLWTQWLKRYATVNGPITTVDYGRAKGEPSLLDAYLKDVEALSKSQYEALSGKEKLAFLINAYNALTVKWILMHYPIKSIKDTGSLFSSPWKKKFFKLFGEDQSLDGIEHGMIRHDFDEPRIHFAVVCASKGCPALKGEAYVAGKLEEQLESSANNFLKDSTRNRYNASENKFYLSKIFDWYESDFKKKFGSVQQFVAPRMATTPAQEKKMQEASLKFLDYDWSLNETPAGSH